VVDPGQYGVFVFFLVSGYIVPASLEHTGSMRSFCVSRVFRLYPLYLFAVGAMLVLSSRPASSSRSPTAHPDRPGPGPGGRGRARIAGAALAAATGPLVVAFNSGYAAPWESFAIFALMFMGTVLYHAEHGEYPWRRVLLVVIVMFGGRARLEARCGLLRMRRLASTG
jgi:peptidoglycan/LPS O-acetylase OafA/YrhL